MINSFFNLLKNLFYNWIFSICFNYFPTLCFTLKLQPNINDLHKLCMSAIISQDYFNLLRIFNYSQYFISKYSYFILATEHSNLDACCLIVNHIGASLHDLSLGYKNAIANYDWEMMDYIRSLNRYAQINSMPQIKYINNDNYPYKNSICPITLSTLNKNNLLICSECNIAFNKAAILEWWYTKYRSTNATLFTQIKNQNYNCPYKCDSLLFFTY